MITRNDSFKNNNEEFCILDNNRECHSHAHRGYFASDDNDDSDADDRTHNECMYGV